MIEPATAERLLPYAKGEALELLFARTPTLDYGIGSAPSREAVISKWPSLSSDDACSIVEVVTDPTLLDWILLKDRRKSVRREIGNNKHLHPVSRLFLLQSALISKDDDLAEYAMSGFPARDLVAMYLDDPNLPVDIHALADKLIELRDVELTLTVKDAAGELILHIITREDILFGLDVAEAAGIPVSYLIKWSNLRYPITNDEYSADDLRRILAALGDERGIPFVAGLAGDDIEKMIATNPRVAAYSLNQLDHIGADVATFCIERDLVTSLRLGEAALTDDALTVLIEADVWRENPTVLLQHPDRNRVLAMIGHDLAVVLAGAVAQGSGPAAGEWLASVADRFSPAALWDLVAVAGIRANSRFVRALSPTTDEVALYRAVPDNLLTALEDLPDKADLSDLLERSSRQPASVRQHVTLLVLGSSRTREVQDDIIDDAVDAMVSVFNDDAIVSWLQAKPGTRPSTQELNSLVARHPEVIARIAERKGVLGRYISATPAIVALMRPANGWGAFVAQTGAEEVYTVLSQIIGDAHELWEPALTLFDSWTGSLEELMATARAL